MNGRRDKSVCLLSVSGLSHAHPQIVRTCTWPSPGGARSSRCISHQPLTSRHSSPSAAPATRSARDCFPSRVCCRTRWSQNAHVLYRAALHTMHHGPCDVTFQSRCHRKSRRSCLVACNFNTHIHGISATDRSSTWTLRALLPFDALTHPSHRFRGSHRVSCHHHGCIWTVSAPARWRRPARPPVPGPRARRTPRCATAGTATRSRCPHRPARRRRRRCTTHRRRLRNEVASDGSLSGLRIRFTELLSTNALKLGGRFPNVTSVISCSSALQERQRMSKESTGFALKEAPRRTLSGPPVLMSKQHAA